MQKSQRIPDEQRYKVDKITGCWNYIMSISGNGYGAYWLKNKYKWVGAHRYFYEKYKGKIKDNLHLDHICKNRKCVNPKHLEPVTLAENLRRASKLNWSTINKIKLLYKKGIYQVKIAKKFNINQSQVSRIINGLRWQE